MKKLLLRFLLIVLPVVIAGSAYAGVYVAKSGDFRTASTWTGPVANHVPIAGDIAIIPSGITVTFTVSTDLTSGGGDDWNNPIIYVYGTLEFLSTLDAAPQYDSPGNVYVLPGGKYWDNQLDDAFYMNAVMSIYIYAGATYLETPYPPGNYTTDEYGVNPENYALDFNPTVPGTISSPGPKDSNNPNNYITHTTTATNPPDAPAVAAIGSASNATITSATVSGTVYSSNVATTNVVFEYSPNSNFLPLYSTAASTTNVSALQKSAVTANLTGLSSATTYYYRIKTTNSAGSQTSDVLTFTTPIGPPSGLAASNVLVTSFKVSWSAATGASSYQLDVSTSSGFSSYVSGYNSAPVSSSQLGATVTGLSPGTLYYYRVRSVSSTNAVSVNSSTASQTTDALPVVSGTVASQAVNDNSTISPFSGVSINDADAGQTESVSVTLDNSAKGSFTTLSGFSNAGNGVYTFSGSAGAAQSAIRGMVFTPAANRVLPGSTETTILTIAVNDGAGGATSNNTTTIVSKSIDDAPVLANGSTVGYIEGGTVATAASAITVSDVDNSTLSSATVAITNGFLSGDVLAATTSGTGITASYNGTTGILSLNGSDNLANYQQVLRSVTFSSTSQNPTNNNQNPSRTVSFAANDGTLSSSATTSTINITANDQAAVLSGSATVNYTQGGSAVTANPAIGVTDIDNTTLVSATVSITNGFLTGDMLSANTAGTAISANYSGGTGVLSLTGTETLANYQAVLRTITYSSTSSSPTSFGAKPSRTLSFIVNDGTLNSSAVTSAVNVIAVYVAPGNALAFDGGSDGVFMGKPLATITGSFTVEAWVKPNDGTKDMHVFSTRDGVSDSFDIQILNGTTIHGDVGSGSAWLNTAVNANFSYSAGQWMHIAYVVTPGTYTIYANGNQVGSGTISGGTPLLYNSTNAITIGYDPGESTVFNGNIDEVRVYNSALTQANIQADMTSTASSVPGSLVNYYNFDNGIAAGANTGVNLLTDIQSGYNGTVSAFSLTGTTSNWIASNAMTVPVATAATNVSSTSFTPNWNAPATGTATSYRVEVSKTADFEAQVTGSPFSTTTRSLNITGLSQGTTYYYRVEALNSAANGMGAPSNVISATTTLVPMTISYTTPNVFTSGASVSLPVTLSGGTVPATIPGQVTTYAGSGAAATTNGATLLNSAFNHPFNMAFDASGNMYITCAGDGTVRKITATGVVSTFASGLTTPTGIAVDGSGNVYVTERTAYCITKITSGGTKTIITGTRGTAGHVDGAASSALFADLFGLTYDGAGDLYIVDGYGQVIRKLNLNNNTVSTIAGTSANSGATDGALLSAKFNFPDGIAMDRVNNILYVADQANDEIRAINLNTNLVSTLAGSTTSGNADGTGTAAKFANPLAVATDLAGNVYVGDQFNHTIRKITPGGVVTTIAGSGSSGNTDGTGTAASFLSPNGLAFNSAGDLFVADQDNNTIRKLEVYGYGISPALPAGLTINSDGSISGTPTVASLAKDYTVTAINPQQSATATVNITTKASNDAGLLYVTLTNAQGTSLSTNDTLERVYVTAGQTYFTVTPHLNNVTATVTVNGTSVANNTPSQQLGFSYTDTTYVKIKVTAQDGITSKTYIYYLVPVYDLKNLSLNTGTLAPAFSSSTFSYSATVFTDSISLTPVTYSGRSVSINGVPQNSGTSIKVPLHAGNNAITMVAFGDDGLGGTYPYTVNINRISRDANMQYVTLTNALGTSVSMNDTLERAYVTGSNTYFTITPHLEDTTARVTINGVSVANNTPSQQLGFSYTDTTYVKIKVTAQDGVTTKTYTYYLVPVYDLKSVAINGTFTPAFTNSNFIYSGTITGDTLRVTPVTFSGGTVMINNVTHASGSPVAIHLQSGNNTIRIVAPGPDGAGLFYAYIFNINSISRDADINSISINYGELKQSFGYNDTVARVSVDAGHDSYRVTPVLDDTTARITINGVNVSNNITSQPLYISKADTTFIKLKVAAQDGVTTKTYTLYTVPVYDLKNLTINGTLNTAFADSVFNYTATVYADSLKISPVTFSGNNVGVNGSNYSSGSTITLPLQAGDNTITILAPGSDGLGNAYPYTLIVHRPANADLAALTIDAGTLSPSFNKDSLTYSVEVTDDVNYIGITAVTADSAASISYAGNPEASNSTFYVPLNEGDNQIPILVTSSDNSSAKTYTLNIHKDISADLLSLNVSSGVLNPRIIQDNTINTFTASVDNAVSSVILTPTLVSSIATMTVNGQTVASGTPSQGIPLTVGDNTVTIVVTSPDTVRDFTVNIHRAAAPPTLALGSSASSITEVYDVSVPITPLTSPFSGVAAPGSYSAWPKVIDATSFDTPTGIAVDGAGNIYVANYSTGAVSKMPKGGGAPVVVDNASLVPYGIAVDSAGNNLYITDLYGKVRQVALTPQGQNASFDAFIPTDVAVDRAGNLFVLHDGTTLSEIKNDAGRTVTDIYTGFSNPYGVTLDQAGNLYVADAADPDGKITKFPVAGPAYGPPVKIGSGFGSANSVAADTKGNVFVLDFNAVKQIAPDGATVTTLSDAFGGPFGIALDRGGNIYVSDNYNSAIDVLQPSGGYTITPSLPAGLALDAATGTVSGTPTTEQPAKDYMLSGFNAGGVATADINITINSAPATVNAIAAVDTLLTNKDTVSYKVTFGSAITGLTAGNFALSGTAGTATISSVTGNGATWNVKLNTGATDGNLILSLVNSTGLSTTLTNTLPVAGNAYTIDKTAPQFTSLYDESDNPNYAVAVIGNIITLYFSSNEPIRTPVVTIAGHSVTADSLGSNKYVAHYTMTGSDSPGRVHFTVSMTDLAGNTSSNNDIASGADVEFSLSQALVSLNLTTPTVTNGATATWHAKFSGDVSGLTPSAFSISQSGTAAGSIASVTQTTPSEYDITVDAVHGDGTLTLNLADVSVVNPALTNTLPFVGQTDTVDNTLPVVSIGNPSVTSTVHGPVTYTLYYGDANFNGVSLSPSDITLNSTGTANASVSVSGSGLVYTVTLASITGTGTLGISLAPGTASDKAGNLALAAGPSPVFVVQSTDATLANLSLDGASLDQTFNPNVTSYTASVSNAVSAINVTALTANNGATLTIGGNNATSGLARSVSLSVGMNSIPVIVTAQDGVTTQTYSLMINRAASSNSSANNLAISSGTLSPAFSPATLGYTASVGNAVSSVILTPTLGDAGESVLVKVNGTTVASNANPATIDLNPGANTITTLITAADGATTSTYTIVITRATLSSDATLSSLSFSGSALSPVFNPATLNYTASTTSAIQVIIATANDATATIKINNVAVRSGSAFPLSLIDKSSAININVTAADGVTTRNYAVTVSRKSSLTLKLTPASTLTLVSSNTQKANYTTSVSATTASVTLTATSNDPAATISIGGVAVASGSPSAPITLNTDGTPTIVTAVVTSGDGSQKSYVISISRNGSSDLAATLKLTPSATLISTSSSNTLNAYTTSVSTATASVTLTASVETPGAVITINGTTVNSGVQSAPIALHTDGTPTVVTTVVTAGDGEHKTYVISIAREGSSDLSLGLKLTPSATLTNVSSSTFLNIYNTSVSAATASVTLTPTTSGPGMTVRVNGNIVASGSPSAPIILNTDGTPTAAIATVTAQNGQQKAYLIEISRTGSSDATAVIKLSPASTLTTVSGSSTLNTYTTTVSAVTTSVTLTATPSDANATVTVNGSHIANGAPSGQITLNTDGTPTVVTAVVTAENGVSSKTYQVSISKAASSDATAVIKLNPTAALTLVSGGSTLNTYIASVNSSINSITLTATPNDPNATIMVNGSPVANGAPSGPITLNTDGTPTVINTVVTAQNGTTSKTYRISINKTGSSDATALIKLNPTAALTLVSGSSTLNTYTASVSAATTSVTLTATPSDANAMVTVNGSPVANGIPSGPIMLNTDGTPTVINTVVTAQNGTTSKTYKISINKTGSSDATAVIKLNPTTALTLVSGGSTLNTYIASVSSAINSITLTATPNDANATVTVNGSPVANGISSGPITLNTDGTPTTVTTVVTAENGTISKSYVISISIEQQQSGQGLFNIVMPLKTAITDSTKLTRELLPSDEVAVHQAVSPNGDGLNDVLKVDNIETYPDNHIVIMNRGGMKVYEAQGYNNNSRAFDGRSSFTGALQQAGTYYYILDYKKDGVNIHKTGYFVLKY